MYIFTPDEIRLIHEERVHELTNHKSDESRVKLVNSNPIKWARKFLKRNDADSIK